MVRLARSFSVQSKEQADRFDAIAQAIGLDRSGLIQAIADGEMMVQARFGESEQQTIDQALSLLAVADPISALALAQVLGVSVGVSPAIPELLKGLEQKQPFATIYVDGEGQPETTPCQGGRLIWREKRFYLEALATEPHPKNTSEQGGLEFNRCFRLDRLKGITKAPELEWALPNEIDATFTLSGGAAFRYTPQSRDRAEWIGDREIQITRPISSAFWFRREIFRYGAACRVVSPDWIADAIATEIRQMLNNYQENQND